MKQFSRCAEQDMCYAENTATHKTGKSCRQETHNLYASSDTLPQVLN